MQLVRAASAVQSDKKINSQRHSWGCMHLTCIPPYIFILCKGCACDMHAPSQLCRQLFIFSSDYIALYTFCYSNCWDQRLSLKVVPPDTCQTARAARAGKKALFTISSLCCLCKLNNDFSEHKVTIGRREITTATVSPIKCSQATMNGSKE